MGSDGVQLAASVKEVQGTDFTAHKPDPFYRPQKKFRKGNVFTIVCHREQTRQTPARQTPARQTPLHPSSHSPPRLGRPSPGRHLPLAGRHHPQQTRQTSPPSRWLLQRTVRILLECILFMLVHTYF